MKFIISENRMLNLIGSMVHLVFPKFNKQDAEVVTWSNGDETYLEYYDPIKGGRPFARYWIWSKELRLNPELFETLQIYFDEDKMNYVIDWFNQEFNQDAESIYY